MVKTTARIRNTGPDIEADVQMKAQVPNDLDTDECCESSIQFSARTVGNPNSTLQVEALENPKRYEMTGTTKELLKILSIIALRIATKKQKQEGQDP